MELQVLGPIVVTDHGMPIDIGGPRQRRLLAALIAAADQAVATDRLIEIVFEGRPPAGASTTFRTYVARLRKALGDTAAAMIETVSRGYVLHSDRLTIDARQFETDLRLGRRQLADQNAIDASATFRAALTRWRGAAYSEFAGEDWVEGESARLDELRTEAEELLIDAQLACGLDDDVIPELHRLVPAHPLRERFRGQLMLALHRTGRHAEALRAFDDYRSELVELGLEPSTELVALERSIAVHDPALQLVAPAGRSLRGYRLGASLGRGRQGEVFRAVQPIVGREVAIKVIRPELADSPAFIRAFDTRAQAVSKLEHAHIVALHDFWREPSAAYVVMRLMPSSLATRLEHGPLEIDDVTTLVRQLGAALGAAHRAGVVHGDVRPSNVLLDSDGNYYLSDFRLADVELLDAAPADPTGFEAPEVRGWQRPAPASDQFALAVLVADALTGVLPFGRRGIASPEDHFPSVHGHRRSVPVAIDEVLWRAAAWDPADRYDDVETLTDQLVAALGGRPADRPDRPLVNPFRGLAPFTEADAPWFFGREHVVDEVLRRLGPGGPPMVTVIGASGSGKSSVVSAGVLPRLRHGEVVGSADWLIATMVPGEHPIGAFAAAIRSIATLDDAEVTDERSPAAIVRAAIPQEHRVLLVIDQMEEVFTLARATERDSFIGGLATAVCDGELRVLATLRADFSDRPFQHSRFGRLVADGVVPLVAMNAGELDEAIRQPAHRSGVDIEPTLVSELIADIVDQPSALPLLQFTLTELFELRSGRAVTLDSYRELGGVDGAVARRADDIFAALSPIEADATRRLFLRLVAVDESGAAVRRRVPRAELAELGDPTSTLDRLLDPFGRARLLVFDRDRITREPTIELAHDSLVTHWPRLREWVGEAGRGLRIRGQLTAAAQQWIADDREDGNLYRGGRLETALTWADGHEGSLTTTEWEFLTASTAARDAVEAARRSHVEQQARANRRLRTLVAAIATALAVALGAGVLAVRQWNRADLHATRAETRELVAASTANLGSDPDLSVNLALAAIERSDAETEPEAVQALHLAVLEHRVVGLVRLGTFRPATATFSPDGTSFAVIGENPATVAVWSTESRRRELTLSGHTEPVTSVTFSPDGGTIATSGIDGRLRLWSADTGEAVGVHHPPVFDAYGLVPIMRVAFAPDGSSVAGTFFERTFVWDIETGTSMRLRSPESTLFTASADDAGLAYHPDGSMLATTQTTDGRGLSSILVWDITTGRIVQEFAGHTATVTDVEFSRDGSLLYSAGRDGTVRIWDVERGVAVGTFAGQHDQVLSLDISPDGAHIASAGTSQALIWNAATFQIEARLSGHQGPVESIEFSPDGSIVLTGSSSDGTARLWSLADPTELMVLPSVAEPESTSSRSSALLFGVDGTTLTVAHGHALSSWSIPSGRQVASLPAPGSSVSSLVASLDGTRLAAAGSEGTVVYDTDSGEVRLRPIAETAAAGVAFAPDGSRLVSTGPGAKLTDLDTGTGRSLASAWLWTFDGDFSPDGTELTIAHTADMTLRPDDADGNGVIDVLDADTLEILTTIAVGPAQSGHTDQVVDLEYSPDGSLLATAGKDATAIVWDTDGYVQARRLAGHATELTALTFDHDGDRLATASLDGTVRIWDVESGRNTLTLPSQRPRSDVAFSPDGRYLSAVDQTGAVDVYLLDTDELVALAQERVTRDLTEAECRHYLHTATCPSD